MKLVKLSQEIFKAFEKMVQDYKLDEDWNSYYKYQDGVLNFKSFLSRLNEIENNIELEEGVDPFFLYFLTNNEGSEIRGIIKISNNRNFIHGNISYNTPPSMRLKGYGNKMLNLGINVAFFKLDISEVFVSCDINSVASRKIILNNDASLIDIILDKEEDRYIERYVIRRPSI